MYDAFGGGSPTYPQFGSIGSGYPGGYPASPLLLGAQDNILGGGSGSIPMPTLQSNQYGMLPTFPTQTAGTTAGLPSGVNYSTSPLPIGNYPIKPSATGIGSETSGQYFAVNPLDPSLTQGMFNLIGGGMAPNMSLLQQMAATGMPTSVGPAWDAMVAAMQRPIEQGQANLREQFNFAGNLAGSPFGTAMTDYQAQTAKDLNSILAQMQAAASEAATGRMAGTQQYLGNLGYGAATTFPPTLQSFQGLGTLGTLLMGLPGILQSIGLRLPTGGAGGAGGGGGGGGTTRTPTPGPVPTPSPTPRPTGDDTGARPNAQGSPAMQTDASGQLWMKDPSTGMWMKWGDYLNSYGGQGGQVPTYDATYDYNWPSGDFGGVLPVSELPQPNAGPGYDWNQNLFGGVQPPAPEPPASDPYALLYDPSLNDWFNPSMGNYDFGYNWNPGWEQFFG